MAFVAGKNSVIKIDNSGGTLTAVTAYVMSVKLKRSGETAETTVFSNSAKTYIATLTDATISIDGHFDITGAAIFEAALGNQRSIEFDPEGTASGTRIYTFEALCTSLSVDSSVGDKVSISAEFQVTGAITVGTN